MTFPIQVTNSYGGLIPWGLKEGDQLLTIDGVSVVRSSLLDINNQLSKGQVK
jgi:hypothetical protein